MTLSWSRSRPSLRVDGHLVVRYLTVALGFLSVVQFLYVICVALPAYNDNHHVINSVISKGHNRSAVVVEPKLDPPGHDLNITYLGLLSNLSDSECAEAFLHHYQQVCQRAERDGNVTHRLTPANQPQQHHRTGGVRRRSQWQNQRKRQDMAPCPCVPRDRLGK